eukprot:253380-Pelagomonas_calceolata.AAC.1
MDVPLFWKELLWLALSAPRSPRAPLYFSMGTRNWGTRSEPSSLFVRKKERKKERKTTLAKSGLVH